MSEYASSSKTAPVYVPYATLISALDALRVHGIPFSGKIDKTIWESQSGSIRGQLILAFKFLGLIDDQNRALPPLDPLVNAPSMEERKPLLKKIVEEKYRDIITLGLTTISPGQLQEAFRKFGISGSTLTSATRFFVKACAELRIPIAPRFLDRTRASGPRKKRSANGTHRPNSGTSAPPTQHVNSGNSKSTGTWEEQLLNKFPHFDPAWPDDLKGQWFEGFGRLMGTRPE